MFLKYYISWENTFAFISQINPIWGVFLDWLDHNTFSIIYISSQYNINT